MFLHGDIPCLSFLWCGNNNAIIIIILSFVTLEIKFEKKKNIQLTLYFLTRSMNEINSICMGNAFWRLIPPRSFIYVKSWQFSSLCVSYFGEALEAQRGWVAALRTGMGESSLGTVSWSAGFWLGETRCVNALVAIEVFGCRNRAAAHAFRNILAVKPSQMHLNICHILH